MENASNESFDQEMNRVAAELLTSCKSSEEFEKAMWNKTEAPGLNNFPLKIASQEGICMGGFISLISETADAIQNIGVTSSPLPTVRILRPMPRLNAEQEAGYTQSLDAMRKAYDALWKEVDIIKNAEPMLAVLYAQLTRSDPFPMADINTIQCLQTLAAATPAFADRPKIRASTDASEEEFAKKLGTPAAASLPPSVWTEWEMRAAVREETAAGGEWIVGNQALMALRSSTMDPEKIMNPAVNFLTERYIKARALKYDLLFHVAQLLHTRGFDFAKEMRI